MSLFNKVMKMTNAYLQSCPPESFKDKDIYAQWLAQTYFFVRHSTSLLGYSMPHLKNENLRHHFEHHLAEEERHDLIALKDLSQLGYDINNFEELNITQAFYQSQYYRISFEGGTSLLGYILFLEGLAVTWGKEVYQEIKDIHPKSALFLKVHAEEDPHHLDSAIELIQSLTLPEQAAIMKNLHFSNEVYSGILSKIISKQAVTKIAA